MSIPIYDDVQLNGILKIESTDATEVPLQTPSASVGALYIKQLRSNEFPSLQEASARVWGDIASGLICYNTTGDTMTHPDSNPMSPYHMLNMSNTKSTGLAQLAITTKGRRYVYYRAQHAKETDSSWCTWRQLIDDSGGQTIKGSLTVNGSLTVEGSLNSKAYTVTNKQFSLNNGASIYADSITNVNLNITNLLLIKANGQSMIQADITNKIITINSNTNFKNTVSINGIPLIPSYMGLTGCESLGSGVDLNSYKTPGTWTQSANANVTIAGNYPIKSAGLLQTYSILTANASNASWGQDNTGIMQQYRPHNSYIYYQRYKNNAWGDNPDLKWMPWHMFAPMTKPAHKIHFDYKSKGEDSTMPELQIGESVFVFVYRSSKGTGNTRLWTHANNRSSKFTGWLIRTWSTSKQFNNEAFDSNPNDAYYTVSQGDAHWLMALLMRTA